MSVPAAKFSGVEKAYAARNLQPALSDFNLQIEEGEFVCLLGPSGCGKTTALSLLAGFDRASSGVVLYRGKPVTGPGAERGVVFQGDDSLMPWLTATENLLLGPRIRKVPQPQQTACAKRLLALVGLEGHGDKYPRELSGGMKQRIQIARVLANEPAMLLMDEPFAALDAQTRTHMQDELVRIWSQIRPAVLFITHDLHEALILADRIDVMRAGPRSSIRASFQIHASRPRDRSDPQLAASFGEIQTIMAEEFKQTRQ